MACLQDLVGNEYSFESKQFYAKLAFHYLNATQQIFQCYISDVFCIISSDFCHWGSRFSYNPMPTNNDIQIFEYIERLDREGMVSELSKSMLQSLMFILLSKTLL